MRGDFPVLRSFVRETRTSPAAALEGVKVFAVVPLLRHFEELLISLEKSGASISTVLGIEYSSKPAVLARLERRFPSVVVPKFDRLQTEVRAQLERSLANDALGRSRLLILEVGGYAVTSLHALPLRLARRCIGGVEETKQGQWADSQIRTLRIPVYSIADSALKNVEGGVVGRTVAESIERELRLIGTGLAATRVGVLGFGIIGASVARALRSAGAIVSCHDVSSVRMVQALQEGFSAGTLADVLRSSELVVGATGRLSIGVQDLKYLRPGAILVSASSKLVEFPVAALQTRSRGRHAISTNLTRYDLGHRTSVILARDGFPLNFVLEGDSSGPSDFFDTLMAVLYRAAVDLAGRRPRPGIYPPDPAWEERAAALYLRGRLIPSGH